MKKWRLLLIVVNTHFESVGCPGDHLRTNKQQTCQIVLCLNIYWSSNIVVSAKTQKRMWLKGHHVTRLNLGFKGLSLVQGTREAVNEEGVAARFHHGFL